MFWFGFWSRTMDYDPQRLTKVIQYIFISKRHKLGLTQLGLSLQSQITRQFISQVEGGKRSPSIFTVSALASACNMTLYELFKEADQLYQQFEKNEVEEPREPVTVNKVASENKAELYIRLNKR